MPRSTTLPEPWRSLAERLGGVGALAEAFGVERLTVRRWAKGERKLEGPAKKLFEALLREHKIEAT